MRLWSIHPSYLDAPGLVALWREALLARAVVSGKTRGYTHHPQLERFIAANNAVLALEVYLQEVYKESIVRGYHFDASKIAAAPINVKKIAVTSGQISYEFTHLKKKLLVRNNQNYQVLLTISEPVPHPLFYVVNGSREFWEKVY
jgi:hypothetical protein